LQFNSPEGFIDQSYSLALNFQFDEFISPHPVSDKLTFSLPKENFNDDLLIEIVDLYGRTVASFYANSPSGEIDVSLLASGTYFIKMITGSDVVIRKVLKQ
jgi:hypothetical protein